MLIRDYFKGCPAGIADEDAMFGLLPKNLEFYDCFDRAAKNAVRSAELLLESAKATNGRRHELVSAIMDAEHTGDRVTHETLDRLEQTYITPIDREDIHSLITRIDDVVDMIDAVAQRMMFYKIDWSGRILLTSAPSW